MQKYNKLNFSTMSQTKVNQIVDDAVLHSEMSGCCVWNSHLYVCVFVIFISMFVLRVLESVSVVSRLLFSKGLFEGLDLV